MTSRYFPSPWCVSTGALLLSFFRGKGFTEEESFHSCPHVIVLECCYFSLNFIHHLYSTHGALGTSTEGKKKKDALRIFLVFLSYSKSRSACRGCKEMCKRDNDLADRYLFRFSYAFFNLFYLSKCHTQSHGNVVYTYVQTYTDAVTKASATQMFCCYGDSKCYMLFMCGYICIYAHIHIYLCVCICSCFRPKFNRAVERILKLQ